MNKRGPSNRLRFESETQGAAIEGITSGQLGPKSAPAPKGKVKRRLRFEDEKPPQSLPPPEKPQ